MGYRVEPERLSREEVQRMIEQAQRDALSKLPPEQLKERLEKLQICFSKIFKKIKKK